jgi:hypothetical protein
VLLVVKMRGRIRREETRRHGPLLSCKLCALFLLATAFASAGGQKPSEEAAQSPSVASTPVSNTLEDAARRAQTNQQSYAASLADSRVSSLDRPVAHAGLVPSVA